MKPLANKNNRKKLSDKLFPSLLIAAPLLFLAAFSTANGGFFDIASAGYGGQTSYKQSFAATITGPQEVPPTTSTLTGTGMFNITQDEREIDYNVTLSGNANATDVALYCAKPGSNGPKVASLFHSVATSSNTMYSGMLTQSDVLAGAAACNPNITTVPQLVQAMREGSIYVNVLTAAYPMGEIRGQLAGTATATNPSNPGGGTSNGTPSIDPNDPVRQGTTVNFTGRHFASEENVTVTLNGTTIAMAHADGGGNFSTGSLIAPLSPGNYTYTFTGGSGDTASTTITVTP